MAGCAALGELWAADNQLPLRLLLELMPLAALRTLVLHGNPCAKATPAGLCARATTRH